MTQRLGVLFVVVALALSAHACAEDSGSGPGSDGPGGFLDQDSGGFTDQNPDPSPDEGDPDPDDPAPDQAPDAAPDQAPDQTPDPSPDQAPDAEPDAETSCLPAFYRGLDGVFSGTITSTTRGPGIPEQTASNEISLNFDIEDVEVVDNPNCTFTRDEMVCFHEPGATSVTECDTNGIQTQSTTTTISSVDEPDQFSQRSRTESTTRQDGEVLNTSSVDQTFTLTLLDPDSIRYEANTATTTAQGVFTTETLGILTRQ